MTVRLLDIWAWIKPWKLSAGTSTGLVWLKKSQTLSAVAMTAKETKRLDTRGMAHCTLFNYPTLHEIQYPWTSSHSFHCQMVVLRYGWWLTVLQKWHTSSP